MRWWGLGGARTTLVKKDTVGRTQKCQQQQTAERTLKNKRETGSFGVRRRTFEQKIRVAAAARTAEQQLRSDVDDFSWVVFKK